MEKPLENQQTTRYNPNQASVTGMEQTLQGPGNRSVKDEADFNVIGMTCAACATRIEKGLNKLPGVSKAVVNLALETAHVEYNSAEITAADMINKVEQLGYQAIRKEPSRFGTSLPRIYPVEQTFF
ncbi:heavy metal-associated domain-containing protein [Paenibacillus filicis]|uniref:Heavy metal-associated domain-containing protein n=1 Tax=Paenibacillus gyeongsangnamensis TaxID=3388067 RepID=A0ABT4QE31_9BACL|nr:heavy metal-associated domain-containing protein [Paenibacillus filicis]MCZ8515031.1 heavy metal-associated domain-containing protein [Paenibacillus filicis]